MRLHDTPISVVSIRDDRFTTRLWKEFQEAIGTKLKFSTTCHPQTDGQSKRTIKIIDDLLKSCWQDSWENHLPLVEFAYNNNY